MRIRLLGAVCATLVALISNVPALALSAFPREIQTCVTDGNCTEPVLQFVSPTMVVYQYSQNATSKALIGYELRLGSRETHADNSGDVLEGPIWLSANQSYSLSDERHFFTLHLDQVTPPPNNWWLLDSDGLDVGLSLTTADLLGGGGFFHLGEGDMGTIFDGDLGTLGDQGQGGGLYPFGDNHSFLPCLSYCEVGAEFNLVNLAYIVSGSEATLTFDSADTRKLLYSQFTGVHVDFGDHEQNFQFFYVRPIPLPAGAWLFGSALLGLIGMARSSSMG